MTSSLKRYNCIDLTKFIMAILVVSLHTEPLTNIPSPTLFTLWDCIARCAVPFFFISSGFLTGCKLTGDTDSDITVIFRQLKKILKMYLLWSLIYMPLAIYDFWRCGYSVRLAIDTYLRYFLLLGENYNSWMLWYLLSTVYALLFVALFLKMKAKLLLVTVLGGIALLAGDLITNIVYYSGELPHILTLIKTAVVRTFVNGRIFTGFFYIPLGMLLAHKKIPTVAGIILFIAGFVGNFFYDGIIATIMLAICSTGVFIAARNTTLKDRPIYSFLRTASTDIYLVHMYVWTFYYFFVYRQKTFGIDSFIATTLISLLICIAKTYIQKLFRKKAI